MNFQNWKTQLRKGLLELCVLNCLNKQPYHGYDLVQALKKIDVLQMREVTVYPILARLGEEGLVVSVMERSSSGPPRKVFRITTAGQSVVAGMNKHWVDIVKAVRISQNGYEGENE